MHLGVTSFGWLLTMNEGRLQRLEVDFRLGLLLVDKSEKASLYIETPCYLKDEGRNILLMPDEPSSLAPVLELVNAEVADISIQRTGHLSANFRDGRSLEVDSNDMYESWQIGSKSGWLLVCAPGGDVSLFGDPIATKQ